MRFLISSLPGPAEHRLAGDAAVMRRRGVEAELRLGGAPDMGGICA